MKLLMTVVKEMDKRPFASVLIIYTLGFFLVVPRKLMRMSFLNSELVMIAATGRQASCQMVP